MSQPIDVGSVLGGRYKVTATVLTSHDQDLVLDGVDQVLNRPVSILVAGPSNGEQVAASAREVAMGERPGGVQVLDLGVSEETTYLITNHTSAAELLDLLVAPNPPYVEPFFTDTLGSEIFGQPRSHEPEDDHDDGTAAGYIRYNDVHQSQMSPYSAAGNSASAPRPATRPGPAVSEPDVAGSKDADQSGHSVPGTPAYGTASHGAAASAAAAGIAATGVGSASTSGPTQNSPKVSLWTEEDHSYDDSDSYGNIQQQDDEPMRDERRPKAFPAFARAAGTGAGAGAGASDSSYDDDDSGDGPGKEPRSMRWLVGGLLAMVLVAGLVFALTQLGSLFPSTTTPQADQPTESSVATQTPSAESTPSEAPAPAPVAPVVESVTRQGTFAFAADFDVDLVKAYDGNPASYWSDMEFATENWGGLITGGVPLVVKLQEPSAVSSVTLTQLGASGGRISVLTNDRPSLDGAKQVGTNSFTSTDLTMPLPEPVTAEYIIVRIDTLPRLAAPKTPYDFGLRLAEVKVQ